MAVLSLQTYRETFSAISTVCINIIHNKPYYALYHVEIVCEYAPMIRELSSNI